jgi:hypothetical protein
LIFVSGPPLLLLPPQLHLPLLTLPLPPLCMAVVPEQLRREGCWLGAGLWEILSAEGWIDR